MDLLEREDLLVQLDTVLNEVASGNGRLVFISGEAGIGKTSLVESFVANQKKRARVLWGSCDALFTPRPLGPLYVLKFLGRRVARINALLVVTYRDDEVGADHPLKLVLGEMPHRSVARFRISPLSEAAREQTCRSSCPARKRSLHHH